MMNNQNRLCVSQVLTMSTAILIFITVKSSKSWSSLSGVYKLGEVLDICH